MHIFKCDKKGFFEKRIFNGRNRQQFWAGCKKFFTFWLPLKYFIWLVCLF